MWQAVVLSILVGVAIVVQSGTQATLMRDANLWLMLALTNLLVAVVSVGIFFIPAASKLDSRAGLLEELGKIPPMVLVPSFCGLVIIAGMPTAIARIGVFSTVMIVIACQILASMTWDWYAGQPPNLSRGLGAVLVFVGVVLVMRPSS